MKKIESEYIINQYRSGINSYSDFTKAVGLWESEKFIFQKYLMKSDRILDLGCGTGRTTYPLSKLGYGRIIGVDLTPEMIIEAQALNKYFDVNLDFRVGDALDLEFEDSFFDIVIFSFNGLMSIPGEGNRIKALIEINRVIKETGFFIFTTHDREQEEQFVEFWKEEKEKWRLGKQNPALFEYGDLITKSKNEHADIFIHIPTQEEIRKILWATGFSVVETFYRSEFFEESEKVKSKSGECRFWVARKDKNVVHHT